MYFRKGDKVKRGTEYGTVEAVNRFDDPLTLVVQWNGGSISFAVDPRELSLVRPA